MYPIISLCAYWPFFWLFRIVCALTSYRSIHDNRWDHHGPQNVQLRSHGGNVFLSQLLFVVLVTFFFAHFSFYRNLTVFAGIENFQRLESLESSM